MVDVEVFTDQLKEKHLDKATEARIKKLLGNSKTITQLQAKILQSIIDDALRQVALISTPEQAAVFATINIFDTVKATERLIPYQNNIGKIFNYGIQFASNKPSNTVKQLEEGVKQSTKRFITKMGEDLKVRAGQIVADGVGKSIPVNDIVANLEKELNVNRARANTIARTETMRAAHAGSYAQAIRDGKQYYIVDSRAEACIYCKKKFTGEVYDITDPGPMPPLHPNCACIPIYFNEFDESVRWATKISSDIDKQVKQLEDKGLKIAKDGTGAEVNKLAPDRRLKN